MSLGISTSGKAKIEAIKLVLFLSVIIVIIKFTAFFLSNSNAILSDALESIINIATSAFTWFSIYYSSKLRDEDHPYGHGKIEYVSVGFEGAMIFFTGIFILVKSILHLLNPEPLSELNIATFLTVVSGVLMLAIGLFLKQKSKIFNNVALLADAKHFILDSITSFAIVIGLLIYKFTDYLYIDSLLAIFLALFIMYNGFKLLKQSIDRLLDKADIDSINRVVEELEKYRRDAWIDFHNLRIQKFGHYVHIDCHMTLPFYYSLDQVHHEIKTLEKNLNSSFHNNVELFIHTDPCQKLACRICSVSDCNFRLEKFQFKVKWNVINVSRNKKHYTELD